MTLPEIPEKLLNLNMLAIADMILAGIVIIFQVGPNNVLYFL
jgi:hypothetical protein